MTREELRDYVDEQRALDNIPYHVYSALIDGIDTLEQEPCEDAISRSGAIKAIDERAKRIKNEDTLNGLAGAVGILFELPSVNPQEPCDDANANQHNSNALSDVGQHTNALEVDAISRQAVLKIIDGWYEQNRDTENIEDLIVLITYMDSVKPHYTNDEIQKIQDLEQAEIQKAYELGQEDRPTGHWITEDMFDGDVAYRCSECDELFWIESGTPKDNEYNFCPKCGAKMAESEDKK